MSEEPASPSAAQGPQLNVTAGSFEAEQAIFDNRVQMYFEYAERAAMRTFDAATDGIELTADQINDVDELFVGSTTLLERLVEDVERTRVLLLTGEDGAGKGMAALYVSTRVARRCSLERPARVVEALDQNVRIDLRACAGEETAFGNRSTLFVNAFQQKNRALLTFFSRSERVGWEQLTDTLRRNNACLLFTASKADAAPLLQQAIGHIVHHELATPTAAALVEALEKKVTHLQSSPHCDAARCATLLEHRTRVAATLGTMARVTMFAEHFARGDDDLETALRRFTNVDEWFAGSVEPDLETWCSVLTLTLAQPTPDATSIPWLDFDGLRRAFSERIRANHELANPEGSSKSTPEPSHGRLRMNDRHLIESSRAVVGKDAERLSDVIRFTDASYAAELWKTLLTQYRRVLTHLVPTLRHIAEQERGAGRLSRRILAAQIIGRIGEIDPARISLPLIRIWASSSDLNQRPLVGRLVQGVLAAGNALYRQAALREVALLTDREHASSDRAAQDRLITAISAYAHIGMQAPDVAMEALGKIAVERLATALAEVHKVRRSAEGAAIRAEDARHARAAAGFQRRYLRLATIAAQLDAHQAAALMGLEMAIVQLCLLNDSIEILSAMRDWSAKGGSETRTLLAVLFLQGIAGELHAVTVIDPETNGRIVVSPLLVSLASSGGAASTLAAFLADIRCAIDETTKGFRLPADLQRELTSGFTSLLVTWARDAADTPYRHAVAELFAILGSVRGGMLQREIYDLVGTAPFSENGAMRAFASDVRKQITR